MLLIKPLIFVIDIFSSHQNLFYPKNDEIFFWFIPSLECSTSTTCTQNDVILLQCLNDLELISFLN